MFRCSGALIFLCLDVQRHICLESCCSMFKCSSVDMFRGWIFKCSDVPRFRCSKASRKCSKYQLSLQMSSIWELYWWRKMPAGTSCKYFKQGSKSCHVQGSLWLMQTWWNLQFGSFMQTWLNSQIWLATFSRLDVTCGALGYLISRQWGGEGAFISCFTSTLLWL